MTDATAKKKYSIDAKVGLALVCLLMIYIPLMGVAGVSTQVCKNEDRDFERKLKFCNAAVKTNFVKIPEVKKQSTLWLYRGIALSEVGESEQAISDMRLALVMASEGSSKRTDIKRLRMSTYVRILIEKMQEHEDLAYSSQNWDAALKSFGLDTE